MIVGNLKMTAVGHDDHVALMPPGLLERPQNRSRDLAHAIPGPDNIAGTQPINPLRTCWSVDKSLFCNAFPDPIRGHHAALSVPRAGGEKLQVLWVQFPPQRAFVGVQAIVATGLGHLPLGLQQLDQFQFLCPRQGAQVHDAPR